MILEFTTSLDIGNLGKQRLLFRCLREGDLKGLHLLHGTMHLYSFPSFNVKKHDMVVVYIRSGDNCTERFRDATCHFFYCGKWLRIWEDQEDTFRIIG